MYTENSLSDDAEKRPLFSILRAIFWSILVFSIACRKDANQLEHSDRLVETTPPGARRPVIELHSVGLDPTIQMEDKEKPGWHAEKIHDILKKRLEDVGRYLESTGETEKSSLSPWIDPRFVGNSEREAKLDTVFEDDVFLIQRTSPNANNRIESAGQGSHRFFEIVDDLKSSFLNARQLRTHFKTFHVQLDNQSAELHSYFEFTGQTKSSIIQQRAVWKTQWSDLETTPRLKSLSIEQFEETRGKQNGSLLVDITNSVLGGNESYTEQLLPSTDYWLERLEFRYGIDPGAWLGLAVADVNGDGLDDVFMCQPGGLPNRLYLQTTDGTAIDASQAWGVDWLDHTHAALFVDLDNDRDQDLIVSLKPGIVVLENDDNSGFNFRFAKPIPKSNPYSLSAADIDNDGFLDVYVSCYSMRRSEMDRHFIQRPVPYHDANNGGRNVLFRNDGNWGFNDITNRIGLDQNNRRFSFASSWEDYDNDGDLDLYVANDYGRNNLYRNDNGRFTDIAAAAGVEDISAGMSVSWSDFDNDGWMDLYVSNMFSSAGNRIAFQRRFRASDSKNTLSDYQRHARGNSLFHNAGDGSFLDVSVDAGVTLGRWAWGSNFADINNDGLDDILVANGFITQEDTTDL